MRTGHSPLVSIHTPHHSFRRRLLRGFVIGMLGWLGTAWGPTAVAAVNEPGWSPVIIATGDYRRQIEATPIELRPYRPLHFYGNTVRRMHYRGTPLPLVGTRNDGGRGNGGIGGRAGLNRGRD